MTSSGEELLILGQERVDQRCSPHLNFDRDMDVSQTSEWQGRPLLVVAS